MKFAALATRRIRRLPVVVLVLLVVEYLDEFVFGAQEAALPLIRTELGLSYEQIGLLLTLPGLIANLLFEPIIGILGDVWRRRVLVLGGGIGFLVGVLMIAGSQNYLALMLAMILLYPSSGALVGLSQSTLMDLAPDRHEKNMARWTFAGSVGVVTGALAIGTLIAIGFGWRDFYVLAGALTLFTLILLWRMPFPRSLPDDEAAESEVNLITGLRNAWQALRRGEVVRWLLLLQFSDFMLDILHAYLALYFVDVAGVDEAQASFAVVVWTAVGLVGDFAMIPLLNRVRGITYLRFSAALELVLYTAFLLVPDLVLKLILIGLIGFFNAGWYAILQGNLYTVMPGQSGTVMTLGTLFGLIGSITPLVIGLVAGRFGLETAMLFPLVGCVALLVGLPRRPSSTGT